VRGRVHEMLKKSRQIFDIRFKLPKPLAVVAWLFWLRSLDLFPIVRSLLFFRHTREYAISVSRWQSRLVRFYCGKQVRIFAR